MAAVQSSTAVPASVAPAAEIGSSDWEVRPPRPGAAQPGRGSLVLAFLVGVQVVWVAALLYAAYVFVTW
jgi:hypothetical protein